MNQSGAHTSKVNMARITAAETALRVSVVSWRDHLAQDRGRGRAGFSGYAEPAQVVDDTVSVSRCSARGEDSVGPDECEAAAGIAIDHATLSRLAARPSSPLSSAAARTASRRRARAARPFLHPVGPPIGVRPVSDHHD